MIPRALTIAGFDPSGGAGIQADLKVFHQRKVYGMSVITLLTMQNTRGVYDVAIIDSEKIKAQLNTLLEDITPSALKIGALGDGKSIFAILESIEKISCPIVIDPIIKSSNGFSFLDETGIKLFKEKLLPKAFLITPNLYEASILSELEVKDLKTMEMAARRIHEMGGCSVLVKGGHLEEDSTDLLYTIEGIQIFKAKRIETKHTHGTGCTYSAVITAELAKGKTVTGAVKTAKNFVTEAIKSAPGIGNGFGPLNHHVEI